jgi:nudix-type nucleoside diphosphatase (YffH/AdpP family)
MGYEIEDTETVYRGWTTVSKATVRTSRGETFSREIEDHGPGVAVLPYDPERRLALLVQQFRAPVFQLTGRSDVVEAPAGLLDADEPEACARREAMEEAGLRLTRLEWVAAPFSMPALSSEVLHLYLAPYSACDRIASGGGLAAEHEEITIVEQPLDELARAADHGEILDMKTLVLLLTLRLRRPDLFTAVPERR